MSEITLVTIDTAARKFADAHTQLSETVSELNAIIAEAKRAKVAAIKRQVAITSQRRAELKALIEQARHLFTKPRTLVLSGVKVGLQKGKGVMEWADEAQVVKLIRKHFPEQEEVLIQVTEKPVKKALANLTAGDLKRLGVTIEDAGDEIVIKSTDSDVEKVVNALLADATDDEREEAA